MLCICNEVQEAVIHDLYSVKSVSFFSFAIVNLNLQINGYQNQLLKYSSILIIYIVLSAYKETYSNKPVWTEYRRNHKGAFPPRKTRKTCIVSKLNM